MTVPTSAFENVPQAPADKILQLVVEFRKCPDPRKVNVSIGAFRNDEGNPVVLDVVREVEQELIDTKPNMEYSPIDGPAPFQKLSAELLFGKDAPVLTSNRLVTAQTVAGSGALGIAFEFIKKHLPERHIYTSTPTWPNHVAMLEARFPAEQLKKYRYFDASTKGCDFDGMIADLSAAQEGSVVLMQPICHNPTGVDPSRDQWEQILQLCVDKKFIVFQDCAYQGFGSGDLDEDAWAIRLFTERALATGMEMIVTYSFSKNLGLYGQRTGALHIITSKPEVTEPVRSQVKKIVRSIYSSPPVQGERLVTGVLSSAKRFEQWKVELKEMTDRIHRTRQLLHEALVNNGTPGNWDHVLKQIGMFSYTGLTREQSLKLTKEHSIFLTEDGRISIAGLNPSNVQYFADAVKQVVSE
ncbi:hypothetical protein RCL1_003926 [Eukaryota sp. TZLM3-RCL]